MDLSLIVPWDCLLFIGCLWPLLTQSNHPAWLPQEQSCPSGLEPGSTHWVALATTHAVKPPHLTTLRTILSAWTQPRCSPFAFIQFSLGSSLSSPEPSFIADSCLFYIVYCLINSVIVRAFSLLYCDPVNKYHSHCKYSITSYNWRPAHTSVYV